MKSLTHRDQIHNDVSFDPLSVALLNMPQMQRLGRIYQLGFAHLVYRGGTHTRLSHVMGVAHMGGVIVKNLKANYENIQKEELKRTKAIMPEDFLPKGKNTDKSRFINERWQILELLIRWGALLHDIGHIPLGHTLEDEFSGIYEKHDHFSSPRMNFLWNENHLGELSSIHKIFLEYNYPKMFSDLKLSPQLVWETVLTICLFKLDIQEDSTVFSKIFISSLENVRNTFFHQYMADIVADTICADYLDYLQRDTQNVGLDTVKDLRILKNYYIGEDLNTKNYRMSLSLLDRGGKPKLSVTTTAKNLVRHRFDLAEVIYYHKTKVAASAMLAKVFSLTDKPIEVRKTPKIQLDINNIEEYTKKITIDKHFSIDAFIAGLRTESLLEPIIGDETMLFWLLQETINKVTKQTESGKNDSLSKNLTAIALLEAIIERRLYKNCISINSELVGKFINTVEEATIEPSIKRILDRYRNSENSILERTALEDKMQQAANFPFCSFLIYVPGRKVQAKGIETGAFDSTGKVITLGEHSSVNEEVRLLNRNYQKLWKFLVFVHPKYSNDFIQLSEAVDILLKELFPEINLREMSKEIRSGCRFPYISQKNRSAAELSKKLNFDKFSSKEIELFDQAKQSCTSITSPEELAYRFKLISATSEDFVKENFSKPGSLLERLENEKSKLSMSESKKGRPELEDILFCIESIAKDFLKK